MPKKKTKGYPEAKFYGYSKSGKRVAVMYNAGAPWGVCWNVAYFKLENLPKGVLIPNA